MRRGAGGGEEAQPAAGSAREARSAAGLPGADERTARDAGPHADLHGGGAELVPLPSPAAHGNQS